MNIVGVNMYILGGDMYIIDVNMSILGPKMYILGANMYILGANMYILTHSVSITMDITCQPPFFNFWSISPSLNPAVHEIGCLSSNQMPVKLCSSNKKTSTLKRSMAALHSKHRNKQHFLRCIYCTFCVYFCQYFIVCM